MIIVKHSKQIDLMVFTGVPANWASKRSKSGIIKSRAPKRPKYESQPLESFEPVETIVLQEEHTRCPNSYNVSCCSEIIKLHNRFIAATEEEEVGDVTKLINCMNGNIVPVPNSKLDINTLSQFEGVGHTLAIPMSHNYSFKVCFDLDLLEPSASNDPLPDTQLELLFREVQSVLTKSFITISELRSTKWLEANSFIMTRGKNVHIYFNLDVSIAVYDQMVDVLTCTLSEMFTSVYKVDKVSTIPLPYSAKVDGDEYKLRLTTLDAIKHINFSQSEYFYDYTWYEQRSMIKPNQRPILNYEVRPMTSTASLKVVCKNQVFLTISDLNRNNIRKNNEVPTIIHLISRMKLASIKSVQSTYQLLDYVVNLRNEARSRNNIVISTCTDSRFATINHSLSPLNAYIAESLYLTPPTEESHDNIGYFAAALVDHEDFAVHLIIVALMYCTMDLVCSDERESTKVLALEYINMHVSNTNIENAIEQMMKYNIMDELIYSFGNSYQDLLDYIILETSLGGKYNKNNTQDYINAVMSHVFSLGARGSNLQSFETVIKLVCFPIKLEFGDGCLLYNYKNQAYETVKQLKNSNQVRIIQSLLATEDDTVDKDKDLACAQINANLVIREVRFNEYKHFINTRHGVFYTITGTYLPKTPFLYFNMEKTSCAYVAGMSKELSIMNTQLTNSYCEQRDLLETYLRNQNTLFYLTRMVPGLMKTECGIYTHKMAERLWLSVWEFIDADQYNEQHYFMCQPLMNKLSNYTMCVAKMNNLLYERYPNPVNYDELRASYESLSYSADLVVSTDAFLIVNSCVLVLLMGNILTDPITMQSDEELGQVHTEIDEKFKEQLNTTLGQSLVSQYCLLEESDVHFKQKETLWERAWGFIFDDFKPEHRQFKGLFTFLSESFKFNEPALRDYFTYTCAIYQPCRVQKHMNIYVGSPRCGKTTLLNILSEMSGDNSVYRTSKDYKEPKSSGPSPNAIHLKTKYMSIINEISGISQNLLKTMTGDDGTNDNRTLYVTHFPMLSSCTFLVAACNHLPKMTMPDEAVRDRLVIFRFDMRAVDIIKEPNCLFAYAENCTYKESLNVSKLAPLLSNLLYVHHRYNKNEFGIISPKTTNEMSLKLLDTFMARNNYLYKLLEMCNVKLIPSYSISMNDLKEKLSMKLGDYNADYGTSYSLSRVMTEFKSNFKQFYDDHLNLYVGIGSPSDENGADNLMILSKSTIMDMLEIETGEGLCTNLRKLKYDISLYCNLNRYNVLDSVFDDLKETYTFDKTRNELLGVSINVSQKG